MEPGSMSFVFMIYTVAVIVGVVFVGSLVGYFSRAKS